MNAGPQATVATAPRLLSPVLVGHRSRKRIRPFRLHRPVDLDEAVRTWREVGTGGALMAGGLDLINDMKEGARVTDVIALRGVSALARIEVEGNCLRLGALVTHAGLAGAALPKGVQPLAAIWAEIANPRVRGKGTLGGNVMAGRRAYDLPPCLAALGARLAGFDRRGDPVTVSAGSAPSPGDLLLARIEIPLDIAGFAYERSDKVTLSVAVAAFGEAGRVVRFGFGIGGWAEHPVALSVDLHEPGRIADVRESAARLAAEAIGRLAGPGTVDRYRVHLAKVLIGRALNQLLTDTP